MSLWSISSWRLLSVISSLSSSFLTFSNAVLWKFCVLIWRMVLLSISSPSEIGGKNFPALTRIWQGGICFDNSWDLLDHGGEGSPAINHLTRLFQRAPTDAFWEFVEEGWVLDLHGMTPKEFATLLVEDVDAAQEMYGTTWEIVTDF